MNGWSPSASGSIRRILPSRLERSSAWRCGVAARSAVAETDVQQLVGSEGELPAVVVAVGLVDGEHLAVAVAVEMPGGRVDGELGDDGVAVVVGEVHVGQVLGGVERQAEQALFAVWRR